MKDARTVFEAIMRAKGYADFSKNEKGGYSLPAMQTRWIYFLMGWELRSVQ